MQAEVVEPVIGQQQGTVGGALIEQRFPKRFFARPGENEDEIEVVDFQPQFFVGVGRIGIDERLFDEEFFELLFAGGNGAAVAELGRDIEVFGELPGFVHEQLLDLDATGVEVVQRGAQRDTAEAAPPFANRLAGSQLPLNDPPQAGIDHAEVAGHEAVDQWPAAPMREVIDAAVGLQEHFGGATRRRRGPGKVGQFDAAQHRLPVVGRLGRSDIEYSTNVLGKAVVAASMASNASVSSSRHCLAAFPLG